MEFLMIVWKTFIWTTGIFFGLLLFGVFQLVLYITIAEIVRKHDRDKEKRLSGNSKV
jgi:hypothetical protein